MLPTVLILLWASADVWSEPTVTEDATHEAIKYPQHGEDRCSVCFSGSIQDCFVFNSATCEYYSESSKVVGCDDALAPCPKELEDLQLRAEVDAALYDFVETGLGEENTYDECIPFISTYTDCNKENVCSGCKACECDGFGHWNCTLTRKCKPDMEKPIADHETLSRIIEALQGDINNLNKARKKRSLTKWYESVASDEDTQLSHVRLSDWLYREPSLDFVENNENDDHVKKYHTHIHHEHFHTPPPKNKETDKKLLKYVLKSLVNDALPKILEEGDLYENNRIKRWINHKNQASSKKESSPSEAKNDVSASKAEEETITESKNEPVTNNVTIKIPFSELSEWLNDVHPLLHVVKDTYTSQQVTTPNTGTTVETTTNPDYLGFDEVYINADSDHKKCTLGMPAETPDWDFNIYDPKFQDHDHTNIKQSEPDLVSVTTTDNLPFFDVQDHNLEHKQGTTNVVDDLLAVAKADDNALTENYFGEFNAVNIMKREISSPKMNETFVHSVSRENITSQDEVKDLKMDVLDPIDNILNNKQKEILELLKIKEGLINFVNTHKKEFNRTNKDAVLSIYKFELLPHYHHGITNMRRTNNTLLNKYLIKIKRDVIEVIRDIINIRKLFPDKKQVPQEFNYLIKAMNHYLRKTGYHPKRRDSDNIMHLNSTRRANDIGYLKPNLFKSKIVKILEILDKIKPEHCALRPLSPYAQRILKRIIMNYSHGLTDTILKIYDPNFNLTNYLKNVGARWTLLTTQIQKSPIHEKLHNMKMLQFTLAADMDKINSAKLLTDFFRGRRMGPADTNEEEIIIDNIQKSLQDLSNILNQTIEIPSLLNISLPKKKLSFLSQVKKMLKKSKKDLIKLFKGNLHKTDIVKKIARKNMEEMTKNKILETMKKWQKNLNVISNIRKKRSVMKDFDDRYRRMKSIIPKYLRRKFPMNMTKKGKKKSRINGTKVYKSKTSRANNKKTTATHLKGNGTVISPLVTTSKPSLVNNKTPSLKSTKTPSLKSTNTPHLLTTSKIALVPVTSELTSLNKTVINNSLDHFKLNKA